MWADSLDGTLFNPLAILLPSFVQPFGSIFVLDRLRKLDLEPALDFLSKSVMKRKYLGTKFLRSNFYVKMKLQSHTIIIKLIETSDKTLLFEHFQYTNTNSVQQNEMSFYNFYFHSYPSMMI